MTENKILSEQLLTAAVGVLGSMLIDEKTAGPMRFAVEEEDYPIRVGEMAYLRGDGYMGSGMVEAIEIIETFEEESK